MSLYIHHLPGRLRLRSPQLAHHPQRLHHVRAVVESLSDLRRIETNIRAGSLTVFYDPVRLTAGAILERLAEAGVIDAPTAPPPSAPSPAPSAAVKRAAAVVASQPLATSSAVRLGSMFGKALFDAMLHKGVERSVRLLLGR